MTPAESSTSAQPRPRKLLNGQPKSRPAFVGKLWQMVNDPANEEYIRWMPDGKSIQVVNRESFEKNVLPQYFKHANFSSFVRQLNMYGWHKVQDLNSGSMQSNEEHWQFQSPNFVKGRENLLDNIVRNKGHKQADEDEDHLDLSRVMQELESIKSKQVLIGEDLFRIHKDNELLWNEYYQTRDRYDKHSQLLDRILQFMASVYGNQSGKLLEMGNAGVNPPSKRRLLTQEPESGNTTLSEDDGPAARIHEIKEIQALQDKLKVDSPPDSSKISTVPQTPSSSAGLTPAEVKSEATTPRLGAPSSQQSGSGSVAPEGSGLFDSSTDGLFPELGLAGNGGQYQVPFDSDMSRAVQMAPDLGKQLQYSNDELEALSRQLALQDNSLQQVQDWITRASPHSGFDDEDPNFDVGDFLVQTPDGDGDVSALLDEGKPIEAPRGGRSK